MNLQPEAAWELHLFLTGLSIPYVVIGGMAVQRWGEPRLTQDVDVTILAPLESPAETIQQIIKALAGRPQDLRDIESIIYRQRDNLDVRHIRQWLHDFAEVLASPDVQQRFEVPWRKARLPRRREVS